MSPIETVALVPATLADLDDIVAVENASFSAPWPATELARELEAVACARTFLARRGPAVLGYMLVWIVGDEVHLQKIAVQPEYRQQGLARQMMGFLLDLCADIKASRIMLEFRRSNKAAHGLYLSLGFTEDGIRRKYYPDTGEDAILMGRSVGEKGETS